MMENPGSSCPVYDRTDYRSCVISFLPTLVYLDDAIVTKSERIEALKNGNMYHLMTDDFVRSDRKMMSSKEDRTFNDLKEDTDDEEYIAFESHSYPS